MAARWAASPAVGSYFGKVWRGKWLNLDPSDRYDGEDPVGSDSVIEWFAKGGQCGRVRWSV